jgi:hypothetical protein
LEVISVLAAHPECATEIAAENGIAILQEAITKNANKEKIISLAQKIVPLLPTNVPIKDRKKEETGSTKESGPQSQLTVIQSTTESQSEAKQSI